MSVGGTMCVVLEAGLNGTEIYSTGSYYYGRIESLEGIENFPNVERITLNSNDLKVVDLSALTKVNYLSLNGNYYLEKVDLGVNPIWSGQEIPNLTKNDSTEIVYKD